MEVFSNLIPFETEGLAGSYRRVGDSMRVIIRSSDAAVGPIVTCEEAQRFVPKGYLIDRLKVSPAGVPYAVWPDYFSFEVPIIGWGTEVQTLHTCSRCGFQETLLTKL